MESGEVKKAHKLSPHNRSYLHLLPAALATLLLTLVLRNEVVWSRMEWLVLFATTPLAYAVLLGVLLLFGLDSDDRLMWPAVWSKLQGSVQKVPVNS